VRRDRVDDLAQSAHVPHGGTSVSQRVWPNSSAVQEVLELLHARAAHSHLLERGSSDESVNAALHAALRHLSDEARSSGMSAEELLIVLKQVLESFDDLRVPAGAAGTRASANPFREKILKACIEAYYAGDVASNTGSGGS
jgi:hypothetical protein